MANSPLNFDNSGFLVGLRQIEGQTQSVHQDTQEIIRLLRSELNQSQNHLRRIRDNTGNTNRQLSQSNSGSGQGASDDANAQPPVGSGRVSPASRRRIFGGRSGGNTGTASPRNRITQHANNAQERAAERRAANNGANRNPSNRNRDERGRFTANQENNQENNNLAESIGEAVGENMQGVVIDDKNLDPLIDSFNEVKDALSPLTSLFGWLTGGKNKPSRYERRRDRETQESLDDIEDTLNNNRNAGAGGGGLLSGLLGGRGGLLGGLLGGALGAGGRLLKFGGKRLPMIGALLGAGSLAMNWDNLDTKDKGGGVGGVAGGLGGALAGASAGAMAGSVVPVVGTVIGGVVGGLAGGWFGHDAGQALGETAAPYISRWTSNLNQANLPKKMESIYTKGLKPFFLGATGIWDWVKTKALGLLGMGSGEGGGGGDGQSSSLIDRAENAIGGGVDWAKEKLGFGGNQGDYNKKLGVKKNAVNTAMSWKSGNIGALDDSATRRLVASTVATESAGGNHTLTNKGGYLGRYQTGAGYLAMTGMIKGGSAAVRAAKARDGYANRSDWDWGLSGGQKRFLKNSNNWANGLSYEKYMNSPELQDIAFQRGTSVNYRSLERAGVLRGKSPSQIAGLLKAAHLGGVGNAIKVAKGGVGASDANGTSTRKYYNDIALNKDGLGGNYTSSASMSKKPVSSAATSNIKPKSSAHNSVLKPIASQDKSKAVSSNSRLMPLANSPISSVTQPTPLPPLKAPPLPQPPKVTKSVSTTQKPLILSSNNQSTIPQNVSDRGIAHAVTGGLGEDRWYG